MAEDRRTLPRDAGLFVVAFVATLALLAGFALLTAQRPDPSASPITGASGSPSVGPGSPATPSGEPSGSVMPTASPETPAPPSPSREAPVLVGAGDIARCSTENDEATADLLDDIPGTVFTAGDNAYESGTPEQFRECYDPSWGRHKDRTRPVPGNHEYETAGAEGYLDYFGDSATGPDGETWYSFDLGTWHIVMLDSNCDDVACESDSDQVRWLADDLAASEATCTLAIWHHPRFSSGFHGNDRDVAPFWEVLYEAGADVIINGHDHDYERFAPQDPDATEDRQRGLRQFVVGTGGAALRPFEDTKANSELRVTDIFGVFKMTLHDDRYDWEFIPVAGPFSDRGSAACH